MYNEFWFLKAIHWKLTERILTMPHNPAHSLAKWKRNAGNAAEDFKAGVRGVTSSPTAKAALNVDKYARGVQDAVASGRFVNALNAVTLADWQQATIDKGSRNYANGIASISPKAVKAMSDQQQHAEMVRQEIASMPNVTEADSEARMLAAVRKMRDYGKRI